MKFKFAALTTAFVTIFAFAAAVSPVADAAGKNSVSNDRTANSPELTGALVYALNELNNHLVSFDSAAPGTILTDVEITGIEDGEFLSGIDFRPSNGQLYTVGSSDRLYVINRSTGAATAVNSTPFSTTLGIDVEYAGIDFNPAVDRLRIVTTGGVNIRVNPDTGAVTNVDSTPTFAAGDRNAGFGVSLSQLAYTNNVAGATTTTAYAIDFNSDALVTLGSVNGAPESPNGGVVFTIGDLGVTTTSESGGFDIQTGTNTAYASVRTSPDGQTLVSNLYTVNLTNGALTSIGRIGSAANLVRADGLAVAPPAPARTLFDFDGDKRADASIFRPSSNPDNNYWYILNSATNAFSSQEWGVSTDKLAPADYDGDTKTDIAVWRASNGGTPNFSYFYILSSSNNTVRVEQFGSPGDVLTVGDWDGDGKADPSVYRAGASAGAQSYFFYRPSATANVNFNSIPWGTFGDQSVRGDFDGDGKFDAAVYRLSNSTWFISNSGNGSFRSVAFGAAGDRTVSGDFDLDGKTDIAVVRPGGVSTWFILQSSNNQTRAQQFGAATDQLVPADYDGDGRTDIAVWRAGTYFILQSIEGSFASVQWGVAGDIPVASAYNNQ